MFRAPLCTQVALHPVHQSPGPCPTSSVWGILSNPITHHSICTGFVYKTPPRAG